MTNPTDDGYRSLLERALTAAIQADRLRRGLHPNEDPTDTKPVAIPRPDQPRSGDPVDDQPVGETNTPATSRRSSESEPPI